MYADYDFYLNDYYGNAVTAEDWPRMSERASDYIRAATNGISDKVSGAAIDAVKKCSCSIADVLLDEAIMTAGAFSGETSVSSETVGGWSKSYRAPSLAGAEVEYIGQRKREALILYLGNLPEFASLFKVRSYPCLHRRG